MENVKYYNIVENTDIAILNQLFKNFEKLHAKT